MESLESNNISLDTSFIESQNFLCSSKFSELTALAKEKAISLFITDITYNEILSRFMKGLASADEKIKKPRKDLENNARILRNFEDLQVYFKLPSFEIEDLFKKFNEKLDKWIADSNVTVINTDNLTIKVVFSNYFNSQPPFHKEQKKNEFPDAFTLLALEQHFADDKTYLLTGDNDFVKNKTVIPVRDSATLIDLIIRKKSEKYKLDAEIALIEKMFDQNRASIEKQTEKLLEIIVKDEASSIEEYQNIRLTGVNYFELVDLSISPFSIVHLEKNNAKLEAEISFGFRLSLQGYDMGAEWYDQANRTWHLPNEEEYLIEDTYESVVTIEAEFDITSQKTSFEITTINHNKDLNLIESFYQIT